MNQSESSLRAAKYETLPAYWRKLLAEEMAYDKAKHTIIYEKDRQSYKLCKIFFGTDGSYYVTSPYHPSEGEALLVKHTVNYARSEITMLLEEAVDVAVAEDDEKRIKLAHHPDGFAQFSGQGVISGRDPQGNI